MGLIRPSPGCVGRTGLRIVNSLGEKTKRPHKGAFSFSGDAASPEQKMLCGHFCHYSEQHAATFLIVIFNCPDITKEARRPENTQLISVQWTNAKSLLGETYGNCIKMAITQAKK